MENASVWRVEKSLGFSLGLIWSIGVPNVRVFWMRRVAYTLILSFLFLALWGLTVPYMIVLTFFVTVSDIGVIGLAELFSCMFTYVTMIVWVTRGARILQETIVEISKVDLVMSDFGIIQKKLCLRWNQVLSIGVFLLWCSMDLEAKWIRKEIFRRTMSAAAVAPLIHNLVHWICSILFHIQLLTIDTLVSAVMTVIRHRFQLVNMVLYKIANVPPTQHFFSPTNRRERYVVSRNYRPRTKKFRVEQMATELNLLWEMHKRLREITENFSSVFSVILLVEFLSRLTSSLNFAYTITAPRRENSPSHYIVLFLRGMGLLYNIIRTWMLVRSCNALVTEANKFGLMLHRINVAGVDFYQKLRELSIKHYQEQLAIVACGFLHVDYSWLTIIFSTVSTYMVLIFQLRNVPNQFGPP